MRTIYFKNSMLVIVALLVIFEFTLRFGFGFCDAPLFVYNEHYEYALAPNQKGKRFGNSYEFNAYSQRSGEPDYTKSIILGLGDSVLFGGFQSDQDSIATSIFNSKNSNFQLLNIAAGSWGPDNCAAYLKEHGDFNASAMLLLVSSHDAFDNMDFKPVVGVVPSYPKKQYSLALLELFDRYLLPRTYKYFKIKRKLDPDEAVVEEISKGGLTFNSGFNKLKKIADSLKIPMTLYLHPETSELVKGKYNSQGQKIVNWANSNKVEIIKALEYNFSKDDYRDKIHLNNSGQKKIADILSDYYASLANSMIKL